MLIIIIFNKISQLTSFDRGDCRPNRLNTVIDSPKKDCDGGSGAGYRVLLLPDVNTYTLKRCWLVLKIVNDMF